MTHDSTPVAIAVDPWMRPEEAAAYARVDAVTIRRACAAKRLRAVKVNNGRVWRVRQSWVDAWLEGMA